MNPAAPVQIDEHAIALGNLFFRHGLGDRDIIRHLEKSKEKRTMEEQ